MKAAPLALLFCSACACSSSIPLEATRVSSHVAIPGLWQLGSSADGVVVHTTLIRDGQVLVQEESDYRQFFLRGRSLATTNSRVANAWQSLGGGRDAFVLATSEDAGYGIVGYWPGNVGTPIADCGQGPTVSLTGSARRPIVYVVGFRCSLSCPTASPGRDAAWFVGDVESHTFTKCCATHLDGPRTTVPSSSSFVFWSSRERMVRVEAYRPDSGQFEHMGDRAVPADVTAVFGIFDDDSSILAVTGSSANSKLIEIGLQSEVVPSRFGSMPGFFLQAVRQGPDGGTYAFGIDDVTHQTVIKRSEREKNQTHYVDVASRWPVEMTVGPEGPVVVSLEAVDAGVYDVYVQRFER